MTACLKLIARQREIECMYDGAVSAEARAEYDVLSAQLRAMPAEVTPPAVDHRRAEAWVTYCRAVVRGYIARIRKGESRMNLTWEMRPALRDYRQAVRRLSEVRA